MREERALVVEVGLEVGCLEPLGLLLGLPNLDGVALLLEVQCCNVRVNLRERGKLLLEDRGLVCAGGVRVVDLRATDNQL